jgi:hypothetical protein
LIVALIAVVKIVPSVRSKAARSAHFNPLGVVACVDRRTNEQAAPLAPLPVMFA